MATNNVSVNYDDERFDQVESDKQQAMTELEQTYGGMIGESDQYYQAQIEASKQWADQQAQIQQDNTDFAIEQIEQQKAQAQKDYTKEQSGAYVDWQKQSNQYGANAEQMAAAGLAGTGFSESSQVAMYNAYQNRVATARESYNLAVLNYNNAIKDAQLQNNSVLAEIAYQALQTQLELSLQGFQYKNNLILEQANKKVEMDNMYYGRYQDVVNQINTENAMAEQIRQYNQTYELQIQQFNESVRQFNQEYNQRIKEYNESIRQFDIEIERLKKKDAQEYELQIKALEQQKAEAEAEQTRWEAEMELERDKLSEQKRQFDKSLAASGSSGGGGSIGGSGSVSGGGGSSTTGNNAGSQAVKTDYYNGTLPSATVSDAKKYGTFSNGYQPKGIAGHGALSKTGDTIVNNTVTLDGQKRAVTQSVWKAEDGTLWYWEGREMKYKKFTAPSGKKSSGSTTSSNSTTKTGTTKTTTPTTINRYEY